MRRKSAGFPPNIPIVLGSCLVPYSGWAFASGRPSRVPAPIVAGIGFLGAGAILHSGDTVHGMTTAATIWVNAALGAAAGLGEYRLVLIAGAFTLAVLLILAPLERSIERNVPPPPATQRRGGPRRTAGPPARPGALPPTRPSPPETRAAP